MTTITQNKHFDNLCKMMLYFIRTNISKNDRLMLDDIEYVLQNKKEKNNISLLEYDDDGAVIQININDVEYTCQMSISEIYDWFMFYSFTYLHTERQLI